MTFGATDLSNTTVGTNQVPVSAVYVPNTASSNLTALEGIAVNTDSNSQKSSAARIGLKDGDDVAQGTTTQTKATDGSATSWSVIQLLKGIFDKLLNTLAVTQSGTWTVQPGNTANTTAWKVDGSAVTQPVSGTVTANIGTTNGLALDSSVNGVIVAQGSTTSGEKGPLTQGAVTTAAPTYTTAQTSPLSLNTAGGLRVDGSGVTQPVSGTFWQATQPVSGTVTANQGGSNWTINNAQVAGTAISVNQGTIDAGTQRITQGGAATGTKSNVASSASSVTILAANTSRKGAMIYNDSTQILYLDLSGGTASNSSYSTQVGPNVLFELPGPSIYNGAITGIWAAANGNARVTEFS